MLAENHVQEREEESQPALPYFATASVGQRFLNFILDRICIWLLAYFIGYLLGLAASIFPDVLNFLFWISELGWLGLFLLGVVVVLAYYIFFETVFGFTPAKMLSGTQVVNLQGEKPQFSQIVIRTLCRLIPFEAFSFFSSGAVGWHDSISNTRVVDAVSRRKLLVPIILTIVVSLPGLILFFFDKVSELEEVARNPQTVSYMGISFECPASWQAQLVEESEAEFYQIICERSAIETMFFVFCEVEIDGYAWMENAIESYKKSVVYKNARFAQIEETTFKGCDAYSCSFNGTFLSNAFYGEAIVFIYNGRTIFYLKQAETKERLRTVYQSIDESFEVDKTPEPASTQYEGLAMLNENLTNQ